jgi:acyl transferase domain-containing protein/acyl carrier protein
VKAPHAPTARTGLEVAIVGLACRFPGARDAAAFWRNLRAGVESVSFFSDEELLASGVEPALFRRPDYVRAAAVLEDAELFDADFFGYPPREAAVMDPQHRLFLECAWEALEDAGYAAGSAGNASSAGVVGVYAGASANTYLLNNLLLDRAAVAAVSAFELNLANAAAFLPTNVAYKLDLRGPALFVQTACSTSLVAVHLAVQALLNGECGLALAGGVSVNVPQQAGYLYQDDMIFSPDGHTRSYDALARGTVGGSGVGVIVLKRLEEALADGDRIRAVVRGSAVNNDGAGKVGLTAPSVAGQAAVIREALAVAQVAADTIGCVEGHGSGTPLGDPIEVAALTEAFHTSTGRRGFCALGSVKSNLGHLDAAAGIAGLIKAVLMLEHRELAPSLHFREANPEIDFAHSPFHVQTALAPWPAPEQAPRRAGVSSFGLGGTNVHVVLEEAPGGEAAAPPARGAELLLLSARSAAALAAAAGRLADHLEGEPAAALADVAYTLAVGRRAFAHRRAVVCRDAAGAVAALRGAVPGVPAPPVPPVTGEPPVVFLFAGHGAQRVGMAAALYREEPAFRRHFDHRADLLLPELGRDLRELLMPVAGGAEAAARELRRPACGQAALFAVQHALASLWMEWGVRPRAMLGHSVGEYCAACLAGVFPLADALRLVVARGRLLEELPEGAMLAVLLGEEELRPRLDGDLFVAAINGPFLCLVSGAPAAVEELERRLRHEGVACRRLEAAHAGHSRLLAPKVASFVERLAAVPLAAPRLPFLSSVTGTWITAEQARDPAYWGEHLLRTVRFDQGLRVLFADPDQVLLEVGPDRTLSTLAMGHPDRPPQQVVITSLANPEDRQPEVEALLAAAGRLWTAGVSLDGKSFHGAGRRRVGLPTYPFERRRHWIEPRLSLAAVEAAIDATLDGAPKVAAGGGAASEVERRHDLADWFYVPSWTAVPLVPGAPAQSGWRRSLVLLDRCGVGERLLRRWRDAGRDVVAVTPGAGFAAHGARDFTIDPHRPEHYESLLAALGELPGLVVHLGALTPAPEPGRAGTDAVEEPELAGLDTLLRALVRAGAKRPAGGVDVVAVANRLAAVDAGDDPAPEKAPLLAPLLVAPQEHGWLRCRAVDLDHDGGACSAAAELLAQELDAAWPHGPGVPLVAWRRRQRWTATHAAVRLEEELERAAPLRERGVYLITGGLGRVGRVVSEHLARTLGARLVLVGRSMPPAGVEGNRDAAPAGSPQAATARHLERLAALGGEVILARADVADAEAMARVVAEAEARFGAIHGVVHAAGLGRLETVRPLLELDRQETARQLRPKVGGTQVLDALFRDRRPDFLLAMSSIASVLGGPGLLAYTAGSLYQDAHARRARRHGGLPWLSVDWDGWRALEEAGAEPGGEVGSEEKAGALAMSPAEAGAALRRALAAAALGQIVVSAGDLERRVRRWVSPAAVRGGGDVQAGATAPAAEPARPRPLLPAPAVPPRTPTEASLVQLCRGILGFAEVGVGDSFVELGGNSLQAIQLLTRVRESFGVDVPLREFFDAPTLAQLAAAVEQRRHEQGEQPGALARIASLLDQVEGVAEEALEGAPAPGRAAAASRPEFGGEP